MHRSSLPALLYMAIAPWSGAAGCSATPEPFGDELLRVTSPSLLRAPLGLDAVALADTEQCTGCHDDVASLWSHSVHAYASFDNPWYRASVDAFREVRGERASRFCAGCHDPLLLVSGQIDRTVTADDDLAYAGVTCMVCHSVESTTRQGNASLTLSERPTLLPDPAVPAEIEAHRRRFAMPALRSAQMCGSCHRSFSGTAIGNPQHLSGIDDLGAWQVSAFAGAVTPDAAEVDEATCQGCHMRGEPSTRGDLAASGGEVAGHRWAASHTALSAQLDETSQYAATVESLQSGATIELGAAEVNGNRFAIAEEAPVAPGDGLVFELLLQNRGVGHRFPGGTRDMHDVWLEVEVRDADDRLLGSSGPDPEQRVFVLKATVLDASGDPETLHRVDRFSTIAFDRTLPAHGAQVVRATITLPKDARTPIRFDARLQHRKHTLAFQRFACERSRETRGRDFAAGAVARGKVALDPCLPQPVTQLASTTAWLGRTRTDEEPVAASTQIPRLLAHARALLLERQERVELAETSLDRAEALARRVGDSEVIGEIAVLRARLASAQGRPDEAIDWLGRAESRIGGRPAISRVRGDAMARVWRWAEAATAYRELVELAPDDPTAWRALAQAYGSLSKNQAALDAAERGLALRPHEEGLLRSRWLALTALGDRRAAEARSAWLERRTPDLTASNLRRCEEAHERCRRDRQPIPTYALVPPKGDSPGAETSVR